jgi:SPX domain protein involved in polyphosphate accumulation
LKKCLKNIPEERAAKEDTPEGLTTAETNSATRGKKELITLTAEQRAFVKTLNDEMKKFNKFFMNAEEDLVMRERALGTKFHALVDKQSGKLVCVNDSEPTSSVTALKETRKAFADFHGELVLLEHWTSLNYTALVKILKKHDKRSRVRLRSPFLVSALQQPFYSTEVLTELIKKTELRFRKLHELTSEAEAAERLTNGERSAEKTAATEKRNKTHTKTPPALARTRAAISCWDGMKDEDSVKRPFGDGHTGILKASEPASKKVKA